MRFDGLGMTYGALAAAVERVARGLRQIGLSRGDRVAVYLEKRFETVIALFAAAAAGCVFVPVNPLLKARQVTHILRDCNVRVLVTSDMRLESLRKEFSAGSDLLTAILVDEGSDLGRDAVVPVIAWDDLFSKSPGAVPTVGPVDPEGLAALLYTSGSTGMPKGVMLSHRNLCLGAESVSGYLNNDENDRILSVLPLSFDAGLSQLTTAFNVGACCVLLNYLLPGDVVRACAAERITGLTGVPSLWIQLALLDWPADVADGLRYFANTGGYMPRTTLDRLRTIFPSAKPFLMYGLTEAFRSTYLDPAEVDRRPNSIGKAIPYSEILVVRPDGSFCEPGEVGELVHRGPLVALGYWNDPQRTAERFRTAPGQANEAENPEIAVWSGDQVRMDEDGFLYFVGRADDMIKTSGYRVSPTEVEDVLYGTGLVEEIVALGVAHPVLGQAIAVVAVAPEGKALDTAELLEICCKELPAYMVPQCIIECAVLPRNANGKIDRALLASNLVELFKEAGP
ncbi:MAG: acyl-CoA ligase (AMP-forming), exosortase A system-associated [Gemmatimonadales bacterium]